MTDAARRWFLTRGVPGGLMLAGGLTEVGGAAEPVDGLVRSIERVILRNGRQGGTSWFHPRACMVPEQTGSRAVMTLQSIGGSDYFGPVHVMESTDFGQTWSEPQPIPALGRLPAQDGVEEGVCDVVPEFHPATGTVLALGHQVFYRGGKFFREQPRRRPAYAVRRADGSWSGRKILEWDDPRGSFIYTNNCGQRVTLPDGDILFVMSFGSRESSRSAMSVRCSFDGETLTIRETGAVLEHKAGRGLLEPSLTRWQDRFFVTLRAEDNRGYVAVSRDGLSWSPKQPWSWDNGEPLTMSTTQQHWLPHAQKLFLVYTRKDATNSGVMRWRAPLFMAEVDPDTLRLQRATERIVLPLIGDGVQQPARVALMGNFHTTRVNAQEAWVTVGENFPGNGYRGDLLLARIRWTEPDTLR